MSSRINWNERPIPQYELRLIEEKDGYLVQAMLPDGQEFTHDRACSPTAALGMVVNTLSKFSESFTITKVTRIQIWYLQKDTDAPKSYPEK